MADRWARSEVTAHVTCRRTHPFCRACARARLHAHRVGIARFGTRASRGAVLAAPWTIWWPELPTATKSVVAASKHGQGELKRGEGREEVHPDHELTRSSNPCSEVEEEVEGDRVSSTGWCPASEKSTRLGTSRTP